MKLHVFVVSYYIRQVFGEDQDPGPVLVQPDIAVAALNQEGAVAMVAAPKGFERTVTGVSNGMQDVLVADAPVADSSEADSLKANLATQIEENAKLIADNAALADKLAAVQADLAKLKPAV